MKKLLYIFLFLFLLVPSLALAGSVNLLNEGVNLGFGYKLDCVGSGIECTKTGQVLEVNVSGAAPASAQIEVFNNGSSLTTIVDSFNYGPNILATISGNDVTVVFDTTSDIELTGSWTWKSPMDVSTDMTITGAFTVESNGMVSGDFTAGTVNGVTSANSPDLSQVEIIAADWDNTANPWVDNEVSDTLTSSIFKGSGSSTDSVDLGTAEIAGTLDTANGGTALSIVTEHALMQGDNGSWGAKVVPDCNASSEALNYDQTTKAWTCRTISTGTGDIAGPVSSTDRALMVWDGTGGDKALNSLITLDTNGNMTSSGAATFANVTVDDEAYDVSGWNADLTVPTKNAVRDEIETHKGISNAHHTATANQTIDVFTFSTPNISLSLSADGEATKVLDISSLSHDVIADVSADDHHAQSHTVASHSDTTGTGAELNELTDSSETTLHSHAGGVGTPGGSTNQIQINSGGTFNGVSALTFDTGSNLLGVTGDFTITGQTQSFGNMSIATDLFFADVAGSFIGVGTDTPAFTLDVVSSEATAMQITGGGTVTAWFLATTGFDPCSSAGTNQLDDGSLYRSTQEYFCFCDTNGVDRQVASVTSDCTY